jgi:hypothetical protein
MAMNFPQCAMANIPEQRFFDHRDIGFFGLLAQRYAGVAFDS